MLQSLLSFVCWTTKWVRVGESTRQTLTISACSRRAGEESERKEREKKVCVRERERETKKKRETKNSHSSLPNPSWKRREKRGQKRKRGKCCGKTAHQQAVSGGDGGRGAVGHGGGVLERGSVGRLRRRINDGVSRHRC